MTPGQQSPLLPLDQLAAFAAVAEAASFARAASRLGVSPSALSHAMRRLEARLGVRLLHRTTRSVAPTEAGQRLLERLRPALEEVAGAVEEVNAFRDRPAGRVRLSTPRLGVALVVAPMLARFAREVPDVILDVRVEEGFVDLVAAGCDAGLRLGERVEADMVAVRVGRDQRAAVVGSPAYFASRQPPESPRDLAGHLCINYRLVAGGGIYRWEFERDGERLDVAVGGPLVVDDPELMVRAALDGAGLAYAVEDAVAGHLAAGRLVRVLEGWCPPFLGFFLYYPSRRHPPAALRALVEALRAERRDEGRA